MSVTEPLNVGDTGIKITKSTWDNVSVPHIIGAAVTAIRLTTFAKGSSLHSTKQRVSHYRYFRIRN